MKLRRVEALVATDQKPLLEVRQTRSPKPLVVVAIVSELGEVTAKLEPKMARQVAATLVEYAAELEQGPPRSSRDN